MLLGHKLRSPRCYKVQPDAAYRARRFVAEREVRDTVRAPLRVSYTAAGRVAGAKRALLKGWMGQDGYGTSIYSGPAWPPLPSGRLGPPHVVGMYYALRLHHDQIALQIACACVGACVCVLARAQAPQNLTKKSPLPALICYTRSSNLQISHTGNR